MFYLHNKHLHTQHVQYYSFYPSCMLVLYAVCEYVGFVNKTHFYSTEWTVLSVVDFLVQSLYHSFVMQFRNNHPAVLIKSVIKYKDWITQLLNITCSHTWYTTTCSGQIVWPSWGSLQICIKKVWPRIQFTTDCCWRLCCTRVLQKVSALYFLKNLYLCYRHENNVTFQYNLPSSWYI